MIARILVALDASTRAAGVLSAAAEVATRFEARLMPVHALAIPPEFPPLAHVIHGDPLPDLLFREATRALAALLHALPTGLDVTEPLVRIGQPWRTILEVADELEADLIVLGSHGYDGLDRILGTTAGKVANLARRNVLIVHNRVEAPPSSALA